MSNGKNWNPCCYHKKLGAGRQQQTTVALWMANSCCIARVFLGAISQQIDMAIIGGEKQGFGSTRSQA